MSPTLTSYTTKPGILYVTAFQAPKGKVVLEAFKGFHKTVQRVELLGAGNIQWHLTVDKLTLMPGSINFEHACVYKIYIQ